MTNEELRENLLHTPKNGYATLTPEQRVEMEEYCKRYAAFMDACKTEREATAWAIEIAEKHGFKPLVPGEKLQPAPVPTLEELLERMASTDMLLNLEVKEYWYEGNEERCHACIDACVALVEKYGFADRMVFNSFDAHVLEYIEEKWPGRYRLHGFYPYNIMANVKRNPDEYLYCACIFEDKEPAHYEYLKARGIEPWIGAGVTRDAHLLECAENGAVMLCSNHPADAVRKLERLGLR